VFRLPSIAFGHLLKTTRNAAGFEMGAGEQIRERKTNRHVPSVYHGLSGTKRDGLISKGFLHYGMVHGIGENRTRILLKSLAIPAGFEPATHGVEIRYSIKRQTPLAGDSVSAN
jgi:hypothetical protein